MDEQILVKNINWVGEMMLEQTYSCKTFQISLCMFVHVHMCRSMPMYLHLCVAVKVSCVVFLNCSTPYFLIKVSHSIWTVCPTSPRDALPPPPQHWY